MITQIANACRQHISKLDQLLLYSGLSLFQKEMEKNGSCQKSSKQNTNTNHKSNSKSFWHLGSYLIERKKEEENQRKCQEKEKKADILTISPVIQHHLSKKMSNVSTFVWCGHVCGQHGNAEEQGKEFSVDRRLCLRSSDFSHSNSFGKNPKQWILVKIFHLQTKLF